MPITEEAQQNIIGTTADICNSGKTTFGGSIKAAAFLEKFIEKGTSWIHLDVAGTAMPAAPKAPLLAAGATGWGTSTFLNYLHTSGSQ